MNIRVLLVGFLAVVSGVSAIFLVQGLRSPQGEPPVERVSVVYAASDIKPGETITASMLEVRQLRKEEAPEDAIHELAEAVDRAAQSQLDKGDMLRGKKLAEKGAGRGMAALIRPGMRAFTIQTPSFSSSLAGFILPGNRVDVLLTMTQGVAVDDEVGAGTTTTLLQNAEILAVHTTVNTPTNNKIDPNDARSVTLLVTPEDASLLDLGQNKGTLHLSLRNIKDVGSTKPKPTTMADLQLPKAKAKVIVAEAPAPVAQPPPPPPEPEVVKLTTRTIRGTHAGIDLLTYTRPAQAAKPAAARANPPTDPTPIDGPFAIGP